MRLFPKEIFTGARYPGRKIAQYIVITEKADLSDAVAKWSLRLVGSGGKLISGSLEVQPDQTNKLTFLLDLTESGVDPDALAEEIRKSPYVKEVYCNPGTTDGRLVDQRFPLLVAQERSITMKTKTFGWLFTDLYEKIQELKRAAFLAGRDAGIRKYERVGKELGLEGADAIGAIMEERVAKGWGVPSVKRFEPDRVEIEIEDLFECLSSKNKMGKSASHFFRGYLSGVVSKALGKPVIMREEKCIAKGDDACYFVGVPGEVEPGPLVETPKIRKQLFENFAEIFEGDKKFSILKFLAGSEFASARVIAKAVGISPKNLSKYMDYLVKKKFVEVIYEAKNIRLYKIAPKAEMLKRAFCYLAS